MKPIQSAVATIAFTLCAPLANATLLTNGDFSGGGTGWDTTGTTTGVTFAGGEAIVGAPGTPGDAYLQQNLGATNSASKYSVQFDYTWEDQLNGNNNGDAFKAFLTYDKSGVETTVFLLEEFASAGSFNTVVGFSGMVTLDPTVDVGTVVFGFSLNELADANGTRVVVDNAVVSAVPIPAAAWLFGSGLLGLAAIKRKRR